MDPENDLLAMFEKFENKEKKPAKVPIKKIPKHIKDKLQFLLYSELSKWRNKSQTYLLMVKEVSEYFGVDPTIKPKIY